METIIKLTRNNDRLELHIMNGIFEGIKVVFDKSLNSTCHAVLENIVTRDGMEIIDEALIDSQKDAPK